MGDLDKNNKYEYDQDLNLGFDENFFSIDEVKSFLQGSVDERNINKNRICQDFLETLSPGELNVDFKKLLMQTDEEFEKEKGKIPRNADELIEAAARYIKERIGHEGKEEFKNTFLVRLSNINIAYIEAHPQSNYAKSAKRVEGVENIASKIRDCKRQAREDKTPVNKLLLCKLVVELFYRIVKSVLKDPKELVFSSHKNLLIKKPSKEKKSSEPDDDSVRSGLRRR